MPCADRRRIRAHQQSADLGVDHRRGGDGRAEDRQPGEHALGGGELEVLWPDRRAARAPTRRRAPPGARSRRASRACGRDRRPPPRRPRLRADRSPRSRARHRGCRRPTPRAAGRRPWCRSACRGRGTRPGRWSRVATGSGRSRSARPAASRAAARSSPPAAADPSARASRAVARSGRSGAWTRRAADDHRGAQPLHQRRTRRLDARGAAASCWCRRGRSRAR